MLTREQLYSGEATELLRVVTTYRCLPASQLLRLFPGKEVVTKKLLGYLVDRGRIAYADGTGRHFVDGAEANLVLIDAFWVLLDFIDKAEYHAPGDFPVSISFFADGELYEIICNGEHNQTTE